MDEYKNTNTFRRRLHKTPMNSLRWFKNQSPSVFPPYTSIVLGENENIAQAAHLVLKDDSRVPLVLKDDCVPGTDGKIRKVNELLNWTDTALKGLSIHSSTHFAQKEPIASMQVSEYCE